MVLGVKVTNLTFAGVAVVAARACLAPWSAGEECSACGTRGGTDGPGVADVLGAFLFGEPLPSS